MKKVNARQREFYERVRTEETFAHSDRSTVSRIWSSVRNRMWSFQKEVNMRRVASNLHMEQLHAIADMDVLDLGSGTGSDLSLYMAEHARSYTGIDLAQTAVDGLNAKLEQMGLTRAKAIRGDILDSKLPDESFDVVYAAAVLHHFKDVRVVAEELSRLLRPGGVVLSYDPLQTEPINAIARKIYRRNQDDRDWEWPFTRETVSALSEYFEITAAQGSLGFSKFGLPFYFIPGLGRVARFIAQTGMKLDQRFASKPGRGLWHCWHIAMVLKKTYRQ